MSKLQVNAKLNAHLDRHPRQHWWFNFAALLVTATLFAWSAALFARHLDVRTMNIIGAAVVAVGLAAQSADAVTTSQQEHSGVRPIRRRHRALQTNALGFALASAGASFVFIGQVLAT
ncbi:hypothetical protein ACTJKO_07710 [Curtobacterium sp. 22159]|uniref:hypothetical protein n=1 Tax=Curtobacterium sp. 22159 TaxID=3453882 RepID=UPI003F827EDE